MGRDWPNFAGPTSQACRIVEKGSGDLEIPVKVESQIPVQQLGRLSSAFDGQRQTRGAQSLRLFSRHAAKDGAPTLHS